MSTLALQMYGADLLKLRKKRSTVIWALVLALAPVIIYFVVSAIQHSSDPSKFLPAGGANGYQDSLRLLVMFFGPLAAILIGAEAGAGDAASGVFRDLVVTGRSRVALFASRLPAAIALSWVVAILGYALVVIGTYVFAGGTPTPSGGTLANGFGFTMLSIGVVTALAVGFASLTTSRPAALVALIGWDLIASPILSGIKSLGTARDALFSQALVHFAPVSFGEGPHGVEVSMSVGVAIVVLLAWLVVLVGLGAWRTRTMDA
jgi:ABC-type transport system involved in multi-copper enzyme maturation permease subunit